MDLQEMQRQFGKIVSLAPVMITTLWRVPLGVFSRDQPEDLAAPVPFLDDRDDLELTSQAHEARHESHLVPFVARIGAGFMLNERRRWQDSDILDPFSFTGEVWQAPGSRQPI
jgi:hypothetical protein